MAGGNGDTPRELFLIDGNSLAYRAFFALPESISTSDGRPTNAIFGFASMLVKILTDFGQVPTVVVWDAGMSGRKDISADYKAQRSTRPDLLKLQWPHLRITDPVEHDLIIRGDEDERLFVLRDLVGAPADDLLASLEDGFKHSSVGPTRLQHKSLPNRTGCWPSPRIASFTATSRPDGLTTT